MMKLTTLRNKIMLVLLIVSSLHPQVGAACTIFNVTIRGQTFVGNNEAWFGRPATRIWFLPPVSGKHGRVYVGYADDTLAQGGMNDAGLCFDWVASLGKTGWMPDSARQDYAGSLSMKILEEAATVAEALAIYRQYNEPFFQNAEIMLIDASGASAVVGWRNGGMQIRKKIGASQALGWEESRVLQLARNIATADAEAIGAILAEVTQKFIVVTVYSTVYDLQRRTVTLYDFIHHGETAVFDLSAELQRGAHEYAAPVRKR